MLKKLLGAVIVLSLSSLVAYACYLTWDVMKYLLAIGLGGLVAFAAFCLFLFGINLLLE